MRIGASILLALVLSAPPVHAQDRRPGCVRVTGEDRVTGVAEDGEIALASGRRLKLSDIRIAEAGVPGREALERLRGLVGGAVVVAASSTADRWGRHAGEIAVNGRDVAAVLVDAGLAMIDVGGAAALCRPGLWVREEEARRLRSGLWTAEGERPIWAGDTERLAARKGRFTILEGRVRSVGERRWRTYLNFGSDWSTDTTVVVPKRAWDALVRQGWSAARLRGTRVRARGFVEDWRGPSVEIATVEMIEIWDVDRWRR
ncbi:thermonuclease family protein [Salinarimonas soli]|uniref:Thermonuclease family protein n=1 Tax=Salinarimonas soli TaxID=1638099 RepID=A0A5B2V8N0_9HYPH|nr:thermonuclease family protein [Salinarimonas soli]KAA2235853.1 thermonuclease family protein [Salinarimonas soli]